jgi:hypothetical protein
VVHYLSGSVYLDRRFHGLLRTLLENHPAHLDAPSEASFMQQFDNDKLVYGGVEDDGEC